jgi:phosphatidylglycerophosphate synthase
MSDSTEPVPMRVVSETPHRRFLGLTTAQRNERIAQRAAGAHSRASGEVPTLTVPPETVITPALVHALPPAEGRWHLVWRRHRAPIVWTGARVTAGHAPSIRELPEGAALDVSSVAARRHAAWRLLRQSGKPTDGWLSRHVHRRISRVFSYVLLQLGLSANAATLLTFGVGVASAWFMAQTTTATMIVGGFLFWFASIADGIDGEMARLTLSESAWGEQLDTAVDHATHLLVLAGVIVGLWRQGISRLDAVIVGAVAIATPGVLYGGMRMVARATGVRDRVFVDTKPIEYAVEDAAAATRAPALRAAAVLFVLFRREMFTLTFFLISLVAVGQRAVYLRVLAGGLALCIATLAVYRAEVSAAIRDRARLARATAVGRRV